MRSLTAGLARQVVVAGAMGVLLVATLTAKPGDHRPPATASFDKPIPTRAIVIAETPPAAVSASEKLALAGPTPVPKAPAALKPGARSHPSPTTAPPRR